jgi:hypothetical protein
MCEECERTETLADAYIRKTNRYGWRPAPAAGTAPHEGDLVASARGAPLFGPERMRKAEQR